MILVSCQVDWAGLDQPQDWAEACAELAAFGGPKPPREKLDHLARCFAHVSV